MLQISNKENSSSKIEMHPVGRVFNFVLQLFGINLTSNIIAKWPFYRFPFHFIVVYVDLIVMASMFLYNYPRFFKPTISYFVSSTSVVLMWINVFNKQNKISIILKNIRQINHSIGAAFYVNTCRYNISVILILLVSGTFAVLMTYLESLYDFKHNPLITYCYSLNFSKPKLFALITIKQIALSSLHSLCPGMFLILYSLICENLCKILKRYQKKLEDDLNLKTLQLLKSSDVYKILDVFDCIENVENALSNSSFFCILALSVMFFSALSFLLMMQKVEADYLEHFYLLAMSGLFLFLLMYACSKVSLHVKSLKNMCVKILEMTKREGCSLNPFTNEAIHLIMSRQVTELSGGDTIYFTRENIVALFGSLLTYSLLIHNLN